MMVLLGSMAAMASPAQAAPASQSTGAKCKSNYFKYDLKNKRTGVRVADIRFTVKRCTDSDGLTPATSTSLYGKTTTAGDFFYQGEVDPGPSQMDEAAPYLHVMRQTGDFKTCLVKDYVLCYHNEMRFGAEVKPGGIYRHWAKMEPHSDWKLVRRAH